MRRLPLGAVGGGGGPVAARLRAWLPFGVRGHVAKLSLHLPALPQPGVVGESWFRRRIGGGFSGGGGAGGRATAGGPNFPNKRAVLGIPGSGQNWRSGDGRSAGLLV